MESPLAHMISIEISWLKREMYFGINTHVRKSTGYIYGNIHLSSSGFVINSWQLHRCHSGTRVDEVKVAFHWWDAENLD